MKMLYVSFGFLFLGIGILGIILPMMPGTPFLFVSLFFFTKGSARIHHWFVNSKIYHQHLKPIKEKRSLPMKTKRNILCLVTIMLGIACYYTTSYHAKIAILIILAIKYWVFLFYLKTEKVEDK